MGYEVIDEHGPVSGADRSVTARTRTPEPYDFGSLEPVEPAPEPSTRRPDDPRRAQLERLLRLPAVLASCALLLGAIAGGYVVHQHAVGQAAAQERSVVQAVAVAENALANGMNGVRMASLTVRLTNFGPKPIRPVVSENGHTPTQVSPLVQSSTPHPEAEANGGDVLVTITTPLACDQELGDLLLPVRTVDGQVHQVSVSSPNSEVLQQDRTMCSDGAPESNYVTVGLSGTVEKPYVEFVNQADQGRRVWLRTEDNDLHPLRGVWINLGHPFPMDIDPHATVRVPLRVHVDRCIKDASQLESVQMWLAFQETDLGRGSVTDSDWQNMTGTTVGSVITAAILRACAAA